MRAFFGKPEGEISQQCKLSFILDEVMHVEIYDCYHSSLLFL